MGVIGLGTPYLLLKYGVMIDIIELIKSAKITSLSPSFLRALVHSYCVLENHYLPFDYLPIDNPMTAEFRWHFKSYEGWI